MANAVVVLNAGSSSMKFSLFVGEGKTLEPRIRGQVEGLYTGARFIAKTVEGKVKAVDLFVYRAGREIGSLTAALGGLDAVVFTAGIGQNSPIIRSRICRSAAWLGLEIDETANNANRTCISTPSSPVSVWVIPTDEEIIIARYTRQLVQ